MKLIQRTEAGVGMTVTLFAHSHATAPNEPLPDHLSDVAQLACLFATKFNAGDWGCVAGALHDLGKATPQFQARLNGSKAKVDHATAGARMAIERFGDPGLLLAYAIAGHHAGLADGVGDGTPTALQKRLDANAYPIPAVTPWQSILPLPPSLPVFVPLLRPDVKRPTRDGFSAAMRTRMLFSALIDADRLATEAYYRKADGLPPVPRGAWHPLPELKAALDAYMGEKTRAATAGAESAGQRNVMTHRAAILAAARQKASLPPGLFSLTVPTGGGKTLASLTFALDHAIQYGLDRIIYVIPFTSIIEQTARQFREVLEPVGLDNHVLEHHSAFREEEALAKLSQGDESALQDGKRLAVATENWDAPIIVTTAVQFFESLFSKRPSRCRKLHNIAKSVIIFDEAQTLPQALLRPTVAAIEELALRYGATAVLCTATQPAIMTTRRDGSPGLVGGLRDVREIIDDPGALYSAVARVTVEPDVSKHTVDSLVAALAAHDQVLCIVGTRAQARELTTRLSAATQPVEIFHLSALMCPAHRTAQLSKIQVALDGHLPLRVIATTVIEAGVDIDFPRVFRLKAGLDSIAQAAGRCNREGRRPRDQSIVTVFEVDGWSVVPELRPTLAATDTALRYIAAKQLDPLSLEAVEAYFNELFWKKGLDDKLDAKKIIEKCDVYWSELPFSTIAQTYRLIESDMEPIIIPFDDQATAAIAKLAISTLQASELRSVVRSLQPYLVNVPPRAVHALGSRLEPINPHRFERQFLRLTDEATRDLYSDTGLDLSNLTFQSIEAMIF